MAPGPKATTATSGSLVNGEVTMQDGEETGATPGKLLRHGRG